jgi:hypothetical protein
VGGVIDANTIAKGLTAAEPAPKGATGAGDVTDAEEEAYMPGIVVSMGTWRNGVGCMYQH